MTGTHTKGLWQKWVRAARRIQNKTALTLTLRSVFSEMVGMARCAVPARVAAGGTNNRAALAFEGVAPLHAARTSQRDVPTTLKHIPHPTEREKSAS